MLNLIAQWRNIWYTVLRIFCVDIRHFVSIHQNQEKLLYTHLRFVPKIHSTKLYVLEEKKRRSIALAIYLWQHIMRLQPKWQWGQLIWSKTKRKYTHNGLPIRKKNAQKKHANIGLHEANRLMVKWERVVQRVDELRVTYATHPINIHILRREWVFKCSSRLRQNKLFRFFKTLDFILCSPMTTDRQ